ncbi:FecR domain-containing protein [Pseudorhizobium flavum]|uniref:FecR domain-containing protein n=1 Tax=Pseudorhizobium flavum TaxID=1335061 RepID=UPI00376FCA37
MPRFFRSISIVAVLMLCFSAASSLASEWVVSRTTQQVSFTVDKKTWVPVIGGMTIPNKSWISTGPRGRVQLERGVEKVSFDPKTLAAIITENGLFSRKTEVVQQNGEITLNIEKRSRPHTYIHTPFLAAVVKGTTFTVTVTERDASVAVDEGLVQVSSFTGGQSTNVGAGQQVTVDQAQSMSVAGITETPAVFSVEPTQASLPAVGQPAPVDAGLGLDSFGDQRSTGPSSDAGSHGVNGESSGGGDSSGKHGVIGGNGNGNIGNGNGNGNGGGSDSGSSGGSGGSDGSDSGGSGGRGGSGGSSGGSGGGSGGGDDNDDGDDDDDDDDDDD